MTPWDARQSHALSTNIKQTYGVEVSVLVVKSLINLVEANITLEIGGSF